MQRLKQMTIKTICWIAQDREDLRTVWSQPLPLLLFYNRKRILKMIAVDFGELPELCLGVVQQDHIVVGENGRISVQQSVLTDPRRFIFSICQITVKRC